jgi:hypothetical protein
VVQNISVTRDLGNARHWVVLNKKSALVVFLRRELLLIWATFGKRASRINMVCSYGRYIKGKKRGEGKWV